MVSLKVRERTESMKENASSYAESVPMICALYDSVGFINGNIMQILPPGESVEHNGVCNCKTIRHIFRYNTIMLHDGFLTLTSGHLEGYRYE